MSDDIEKVPTWGYKGSESKLFELGPDDELPEGWADSPTPTDAEAEPEPSGEGEGSDEGGNDAGSDSDLEAENASLKEQVADLQAENANLTVQLENARAELAKGTDDADLNIPHPGAPKEPDLVEIPEDWAEGHHSTRIKLAKTINPEMAELIKTDEDAIGIIKAELEKRG